MKTWPVRRKNREIQSPETLAILRDGEWGVLSIIDSDGSPYGVPLNYAYDEESSVLVFHGALEGRKLTWISPEPEACFTVVAKGVIIPGEFTSAYASVMVFGTLVRIADPVETLTALRLLAKRCQPAGADIEKYLAQYCEKTAVVFLKIQEVSGKRRDRR